MSINNLINNSINDELIEIISSAIFTQEFANLVESMNKPRFTIKQLNIKPRDATYWDKQFIMPTLKKPGAQRKYTLTQSIWIKLIEQMRSLGINLEVIKKLKENILQPKIDLSEISPEFIKYFADKINSKSEIKISEDEILSELKKDQSTFLDKTVFAVIILRSQIHCIANKNGEFYLYDPAEFHKIISNDSVFKDFISKPYFCLSISEAYQSLVKEWSPKPFIEEISILSRTELEILKMIRRKDVNSISIRYKNGDPILVELEEQNKISMEQRFLDIIAKNGYQKISVSTQNGQIVHYQNKIQIKLNKGTK
jgi:DNA-binding transcriptional MerR regulator